VCGSQVDAATWWAGSPGRDRPLGPGRTTSYFTPHTEASSRSSGDKSADRVDDGLSLPVAIEGHARERRRTGLLARRARRPVVFLSLRLWGRGRKLRASSRRPVNPEGLRCAAGENTPCIVLVVSTLSLGIQAGVSPHSLSTARSHRRCRSDRGIM
jgi:hypothetical protein